MSKAPRSRAGRPPWVDFVAARLTPAIKALVVANATAFSFWVALPGAHPLLEHLALGPRALEQPWQLFTSLFVQNNAIGFLFGMIGLWFVGALVEHAVGTRRFLTLYFSAGIFANLATALVARALSRGELSFGCYLPVLALFVADGRIRGRTQVPILPNLYFQVRHIAMFWVIWAIVACLIDGSLSGLAGVLAATLTGYLLATPGGLREAYDTFRAKRQRQRYKVIDGGLPGRAKGGRSQKYWN
jgi:membrane associated rhomboid family serine protease